MKKSIIALLLALLMLFSVAACDSSKDEENNQDNNVEIQNNNGDSQNNNNDGQNNQQNNNDESQNNNEENQQNSNTNEESQTSEVIEFVDFDGKTITLNESPKVVAIYDYAILDILYNVGFEKTGIEVLIVPTKSSLPADLEYYKNQSDDKVVSGGSLFYVDWDVLDIVSPDLVILGARSFGMNAAGERLSSEENAQFRSDTMERYSETVFAKLCVNSSNANLLVDMERNVNALKAIFPQIADELTAKFEEIRSGVNAISEQAKASGKRALFAMMVDQTTLSVFHPSSRFDMLYEEFGFEPVGGEAAEWTDQHGFDVRAEYILEVNPDVIFLLDRSATVGTGAGAENFFNDPIITKTDASINGNIYVLTGDAWYTMTGGFTAAEHMISDINQFIDTLS